MINASIVIWSFLAEVWQGEARRGVVDENKWERRVTSAFNFPGAGSEKTMEREELRRV